MSKNPKPKQYKETELNYTQILIDRTQKDQNFDPKAVLKAYKINKKKSFFDIKGFKYRLMSKYHPLSTIKVNMELSNGEVFPFCIRLTNGGFVFDEGWYIIDEKYKYYDNNAGLWCFDYHEELCFPVDKKINLGEMKKIIYEDGDVELETAINPKSLQKFMESTVIQKLLAGAEMEDSMRKMKMYMIITMVITAVTLLLVLNMSGLLGGK
jgi:mRNA-degrading endonuclease HigB of HigAB toxin-antitoxin module